MNSRAPMWMCLLLAGCVAAIGGLKGMSDVRVSAGEKPAKSWDAAAAARYLDEREVWWQQWQRAQKDKGTVCLSCHTNVPYAMVRQRLERQLGGSAEPAQEARMMASIERRVEHWTEMTPFYSDEQNGPGKTAEAHATEAVMNSITLLSVDAQNGDAQPGELRAVTRQSLDEAWALQYTDGPDAGGWQWQNFHLGPFEGEESGYYGAALLMVEIGGAPQGYAREPAVQPKLAALRGYLQRKYDAQPVMNQLYVLWASGRMPGLLTREQRDALLAQVRAMQQADGGWRLAALDPRERKDKSAAPTASDGFATALTVLAMQATGTKDASLERGLQWLRTHQQPGGAWATASINKVQDPASEVRLFMSDAGTAYAVMALESAGR